MRNLMFSLVALVALTSSLMAGTFTPNDPPANVGSIIFTQVLNESTVLNYHESGKTTTATLDAATGQIFWAMVSSGPPSLTTTWTGTDGLTHSVTTEFPSAAPSERQILAYIARHDRIVKVMKAIHPPAPPPQP